VVAEKDPGRASNTVDDIQRLGGQAIASVVDVREKDQVAMDITQTVALFATN
jgi:hypothetical protein